MKVILSLPHINSAISEELKQERYYPVLILINMMSNRTGTTAPNYHWTWWALDINLTYKNIILNSERGRRLIGLMENLPATGCKLKATWKIQYQKPPIFAIIINCKYAIKPDISILLFYIVTTSLCNAWTERLVGKKKNSSYKIICPLKKFLQHTLTENLVSLLHFCLCSVSPEKVSSFSEVSAHHHPSASVIFCYI